MPGLSRGKPGTSPPNRPKPEKSVTDLPSSSSSEDDLARSNRKRGSGTDYDEDDEELARPSPAKRRKTDVKSTQDSIAKKKLEDERSDPDVFAHSPEKKKNPVSRSAGYGKMANRNQTREVKQEKSNTKNKGREGRNRKSPESNAREGFQAPPPKRHVKQDPASGFEAPMKSKLKSDPKIMFEKPPTVPRPNSSQGFVVPKKAKRSTDVDLSGSKSRPGSSSHSKALSRSTSKLSKSAETALVMKGLDMKAHDPEADDQSSSAIPSTIPGAQTSSTCSSPLSSIYSSDFDEDVSTSMDPLLLSTSDEMLSTKKCQVCRGKVLSSTYRSFLETLSEHKRGAKLNARQQVNFCRYHKKHMAKAEWQRRSYPDIDWNRLPTRVQGLQSDVDAIINGSEMSHFTQKLLDSQRVAGGRRKKVMAEFDGDLGAEKAGYYGGQGAKVIGEGIATICNSTFKDNNGHEAIQAAGGIGAYIQMVIVPEVASRLVAEDMGCDLEAARDILVQSAELGRQLCEELDDEIHEEEEDDDDEDEDEEAEDD